MSRAHYSQRKINRKWQELLQWFGLTIGYRNLNQTSKRLFINYNEYHLSLKQWAISLAAGFSLLFAATYLFYHSVLLSLFLSLTAVLTPRWSRQLLIRRRKEQLRLQFKEALQALTSSLAAGKSLENAIRFALDDLVLLYPDPASPIIREFTGLVHKLDHAETIEAAFGDIAARSHIDEIEQLSEALATCKRSGGNMVEVMKRTALIINEKLSTEQEIAVLIAQKKLEGRMMMAVPFVFLAFLQLTAPDYMAPLYSGMGYLLLTAALLLLIGCFWLMNKLMQISV